MPPKRKVETVEDKTKAPPAKKTSEKKTPNESPEQGDTLAFQIVTPLKESSQKRVTEWSQFRKSNEKLLLWMTYIKDRPCLKETLGTEGSKEAVQMAELWTQVLDDLLPLYQKFEPCFEALMGDKMTITGEGQCLLLDHTGHLTFCKLDPFEF